MDEELRQKIRERTKRFEGLSLVPYKCPVGEDTIGYGHLIKNGITQAGAEVLLDEDLKAAYRAARGNFAWFSKLNGPRQAVIIDMIFNIGLTRLYGFKKMRAAIEAGDFETAAKEMLDSKYARQVAYRARLNAEILKTGEWNNA